MAKTNERTMKTLVLFQRNEITEYHVYSGLAKCCRNRMNKKVLESIARDELKHYNIWKKLSGRDVSPSSLKIWFYEMISRVLGLTFAIKLMENGENKAQSSYDKFIKSSGRARDIEKDEKRHENMLIDMIEEEKLNYISSIVLGLNDALVELTGTLAGLTFALQHARIIAVAGMITGVAAALSMAASEYLSTKSEEGIKDPLKASVYTGITYLGAVLILVVPYFLFANYFISLGLMFISAVALIFVFTYYYSVVKSIPFRARFLEMVSISLGVSLLSFLIGLAVRYIVGINI